MSICLIMIMRDIFFDIMGYTKGDKKKNKKHFNIYNNKININSLNLFIKLVVKLLLIEYKLFFFKLSSILYFISFLSYFYCFFLEWFIYYFN
jgi:hypothetical protein